MKTLIIIPTYNEANNIVDLLRQIFVLALPDLSILVVDDNSPDQTAAAVLALQADYPQLFLLKRPSKLGLAGAYLAGFKYALANSYQTVVQMDADWSHDPKHLPIMINLLSTHDLVIGSRYVIGGSIANWSTVRKFISRLGSLYARIILGLPVNDLTGGYNGWLTKTFEQLDLDSIKSNGYSFQIEMKYRAIKAGAKFIESPICFADRQNGRSKMSKKIFLEALWRVWQIKFNKH